MNKRIITAALTFFLSAILPGIASAGTLMKIGQATYNGKAYNLIYDATAPNGPIVWLDYTQNETNGHWTGQTAWANSLNGSGVITYSFDPNYSVLWNGSWRLPITGDSTTSPVTNDTSSEMGHMYFTELGNTAHCTAANFLTGPFSTLDFDSWYWLGTQAASFPGQAWVFDAGCAGLQFVDDDAAALHCGVAVRPGLLVISTPAPPPACVTVGDITVCKLTPVCGEACGVGSINWRIPAFSGSDPWLDGISLTAPAATQDQAQNLATNLKVEFKSFGLRQPVTQRAATANLIDHDKSELHNVFVVAPFVDLTGSPDTSPAVELSLPYQSTTTPEGSTLRMVKFNSANSRWQDVGTQSLDTAKHIITAHVPATGRFTIVAELPK